MRLIDADALKLAIEAEKDSNDSHCRICMDATKEIIDEQPTAYDVEAKVAELEKVSFERFGNDGIGGQKVVALDDAISIARGKDKCSTCQYSSGHVSTCMLKSSVCYHERRIVRGKE